MDECRVGPLRYLTFSSLRNDNWLVHAFSLRTGGVSVGPYASLNMGATTGDDRDNVERNRRRLCEALGLSAERLTVSRQVHGDRVVLAEGTVLSGDADALIAGPGGPVAMVLGADCPLVLLADRRTHAVAVVHSGRRSTMSGIVLKTLGRMDDLFGSQPGDIAAGIAPAIQANCYEVDDACAEAFDAARGVGFVRRGASRRPRIDLVECIAGQLREAGVASVEASSRCVHCEADAFYSYRRDGPTTGRMALVTCAVR